MAWPVDARYQSFITGTTITSAFLNDIQDRIIGLYGGTKTVKSLQADGTGNNAATVASGAIGASATISSGTVGAGQAVALGTRYKDTSIVAWATVGATGTLGRGANIKAITHSGTGVYKVQLNNAPANAMCYVATVVTAGIMASANAGADIGSPSDTIDVHTYDSSGTLADLPFNLIVTGG